MASNSPHVLVVGAGIIGASVAWHLVRAGAGMTVLDGSGGGGLATPLSWAWINASWGNPEPYFRLRVRSMKEWRRLEAEVPGLAVNWCGGLIWDLPPADLERFATEQSSWGYGIRRVEREEINEIEPELAHPPEFAFHVAGEGVTEPAEAANALLLDAERRGATLLRGPFAKTLICEGGRVTGVRSAANEEISADRVVLAAGAATGELAATAGVVVPLSTPPGLLVSTEPMGRKVLNGLVLAPELHMRQTPAGRILAGSDFGGTDPGEQPDRAATELFGAVQRALRSGSRMRLSHHTVGYRPTPADGFPIVGSADGVENLFLAVTHSGVTLAPAVGRFLTEEVLHGDRDPLLAPYRLDRFG